MEQAKPNPTPAPHGDPHAAGNGAPDAATVARGHETSDASVRAIVIFGVVMFLASGVIIALLLWMRDAFQETNRAQDQTESPLAQLREEPPGPRLQPSRGHDSTPFQDTKAMNEANFKTLTSYGWVDEKAGIARVPIKRAMELVAERGLPQTLPPLTPPVAPDSLSAAAPGPNPAPPTTGRAPTSSPAHTAPAGPGAGGTGGGPP